MQVSNNIFETKKAYHAAVLNLKIYSLVPRKGGFLFVDFTLACCRPNVLNLQYPKSNIYSLVPRSLPLFRENRGWRLLGRG